jgi:hypothetical protein
MAMTELIVVTYASGDAAEGGRGRLDDILASIRKEGGSVVRTSLSPEQEQRLRATLAAAGLVAPDQGSGEASSSSPPSRPDLSSGEPGDPPVGTTAAALGTGTTPQD